LPQAKPDGNHRITIEELTVGLEQTQQEVRDVAKSLGALATETRDNIRLVSDRMAQTTTDLSARIAESHLDLSERISRSGETSWPVILSAIGVAVPLVGMAATLVYFLFAVANKDIARNEKSIITLAEVTRRHNLEPWHPNAGSELSNIHASLERNRSERIESRNRLQNLEASTATKLSALQAEMNSLTREAFGPASRIDEIERLVPE